MQVHTASPRPKFPAAAFGLRAPTGDRAAGGHADGVGQGRGALRRRRRGRVLLPGRVRRHPLVQAPERRPPTDRRLPPARATSSASKPAAEHRFSAEALGNASVIAYRRSRLAALIQDDAAFRDQHHVVDAAQPRACPGPHAAARTQDRPGEAGDVPARHGAAHLSGDDEHFELPMQRSDIADHLGLTIETVSRTLTQFARSGLIRLLPASRSIGLCNKMALRGLNA